MRVTQFRKLLVCAWLMAGILSLSDLARASVSEEILEEGRLQCLQRGTQPLQVSQADMENERERHPSYMRVQLEFRYSDQPPVVTLLVNTAQERVHDKVLAYLAQYRLPCLGDGGPLTVTQEFHFDPLAGADGKPLREVALARDPKRACVVMPKEGPDVPRSISAGVAKVLIEATFSGDGNAEPEVKVLHADGRMFERSVRANLADYRMPCRKAGDKPFRFRQTFTFAADATPARFTSPLMSLSSFLGSIRDITQKRAYFDFATMACPFRVQWEALRPVQANEARSVGAPNANRAEFLAWLGSLELALTDKQTRALLGESVVIDVPCGVLNLDPKSAAAPAIAASAAGA